VFAAELFALFYGLIRLIAMESKALDSIDHRIIGLVRRNGRISWREVGEAVHLSASSVGERVRRLERLGVISGYQAVLDQASLGRDLRAVVELSLRPDVVPESFEALLAERDEVAFAAYVTGAADYAILVDCAGAEGLDRFVRWCKTQGAATTESRVVLRRVVS
jgi:Lrp/AsnC family transcriptional regulator, leucine-responsive regulatory protein